MSERRSSTAHHADSRCCLSRSVRLARSREESAASAADVTYDSSAVCTGSRPTLTARPTRRAWPDKAVFQQWPANRDKAMSVLCSGRITPAAWPTPSAPLRQAHRTDAADGECWIPQVATPPSDVVGVRAPRWAKLSGPQAAAAARGFNRLVDVGSDPRSAPPAITFGRGAERLTFARWSRRCWASTPPERLIGQCRRMAKDMAIPMSK